MRETSLEDFLDGSETEEEPTASEAAEDASAETAEKSERDTERDEPAETAATTYAWTPEGANCAACGTAVECRWRDDGRLVCADCKDW